MGQNFCPSASDSDIFSPITCIFLARRSCRSKAMSWSVTVGLMTLCTVTCCPCAAAPTPPIPQPNAVATTMPETTPPANPAAPVILRFIISPYLCPVAAKTQREQQVREHVNTVGPLMDFYQQQARVNS